MMKVHISCLVVDFWIIQMVNMHIAAVLVNWKKQRF